MKNKYFVLNTEQDIENLNKIYNLQMNPTTLKQLMCGQTGRQTEIIIHFSPKLESIKSAYLAHVSLLAIYINRSKKS